VVVGMYTKAKRGSMVRLRERSAASLGKSVDTPLSCAYKTASAGMYASISGVAEVDVSARATAERRAGVNFSSPVARSGFSISRMSGARPVKTGASDDCSSAKVSSPSNMCSICDCTRMDPGRGFVCAGYAASLFRYARIAASTEALFTEISNVVPICAATIFRSPTV
jgi:hypothetical protein